MDHVDHPMGEGTLDPTREGQPLTCMSCHNPHGSETAQIMHEDPRSKLCIRCHTGMIREKR